MERKTVVIAQSDLERQKAVCEQIREYWLAQGRTPLAFVDTYEIGRASCRERVFGYV